MMISDRIDRIIDSEEVGAAMANTNASGYYVDDYSVSDIVMDDDEKECRVELTWHAAGEADPDLPYYGSDVEGTVVATLGNDGRVRFSEITAARAEESDWDE